MLWPVERFVREYYPELTLVALVLLVWSELGYAGFDFLYWDWLFVSGVAVLLVAARLSVELPRRAAQAMRAVDPEQADRVHQEARKLALVWAVITVLVVATAWLATGLVILPDRIGTVCVELAGAAWAGLFIGRAVSYGRLHRIVADRQAARRLYLFQGGVLALPAAFLAVWWWLCTTIGAYPHWRDVYGVLFLLVCGLIVVVCVVPLVASSRPGRSPNDTGDRDPAS